MPESVKDLADPVYKDMISVTDVSSSSTAWLLLQALIDAYGENEAKELLTRIYENAGPHIEDSGSGPLKKVRAGEVAIGFGLRHQAVAGEQEGRTSCRLYRSGGRKFFPYRVRRSVG